MRKKKKSTNLLIAIVIVAIVGGEYYWLNSEDNDEFIISDDSIGLAEAQLDSTVSKEEKQPTKKEEQKTPVVIDTTTHVPQTSEVKPVKTKPSPSSKKLPAVPARKDPFSATQYKTYNLDLWNYTIKYPTFLSQATYAQNSDGATFENGKGFVLTTYGGWNVFNETITDLYKKNMSDVRKVTYKRLFKKKKIYVKSGYLKDNRIFYMREAIIGKPDAEKIVTLVMYYNKKDKKKADKVIRDVFSKFPVLMKR